MGYGLVLLTDLDMENGQSVTPFLSSNLLS